MYQCDKLRVGNHIQTKEWGTFNLSEVQFRVKVTKSFNIPWDISMQINETDVNFRTLTFESIPFDFIVIH